MIATKYASAITEPMKTFALPLSLMAWNALAAINVSTANASHLAMPAPNPLWMMQQPRQALDLHGKIQQRAGQIRATCMRYV